MPHYIIQEKHMSPTLVYEAPVDEKTKKVREMFDVDEKTGYMKFYNWRSMSRLGQSYRPEDPFLKFDKYDPEKDKAYKIIGCAAITGSSLVVHFMIHNFWRPMWSKPWLSIGLAGLGSAVFLYFADRSLERQAQKDAIYVDYLQKHPERFETIYRPKLRECIFPYYPVR